MPGRGEQREKERLGLLAAAEAPPSLAASPPGDMSAGLVGDRVYTRLLEPLE